MSEQVTVLNSAVFGIPEWLFTASDRKKSQHFPSGVPAAVWEGSVQTVGRAPQQFSNFQWQEAADVTLGCHFSLSSIFTDSVVKNKAGLIGYTPLRTQVYLIQSVQLSNNWTYKKLTQPGAGKILICCPGGSGHLHPRMNNSALTLESKWVLISAWKPIQQANSRVQVEARHILQSPHDLCQQRHTNDP